ncbi:hypothetical protein KY366_02475 [Candidatus Woesearchaeota archaeon]|nr:hypothetical protein [Candidatus Woesearchaeota archaeon]
MDKRLKITYILYLVAIIYLGLHDLFTVLFRNYDIYLKWKEFQEVGFVMLNYWLYYIAATVFILSLFFIIMVILKKMPKSYSFIPIYYTFYYVIWAFVVYYIVLSVYNSIYPFDIAIQKSNIIQKFDVIFYMLHIILPTIFLKKMYDNFKLKRSGESRP